MQYREKTEEKKQQASRVGFAFSDILVGSWECQIGKLQWGVDMCMFFGLKKNSDEIDFKVFG